MTPLVAGLARRFEGRVPRSDLEQAGMVGLLQAARSFDPEQGTPFGGYATPFVMGEMLACVRQLTAPVKVPRSVADNQRAVTAAIEQLTAVLGRSPTVPEIGESRQARPGCGAGGAAPADGGHRGGAGRGRRAAAGAAGRGDRARRGPARPRRPSRPAGRPQPPGDRDAVRTGAVTARDRGAAGDLADARFASDAGGLGGAGLGRSAGDPRRR